MSSQPIIGWVAFKVDEKFVRHAREDGPLNNTLRASGDTALTPYTRFYLEPSAKNVGFVHIRSCYNNKYWVPKKVKDSWYIFVDAKEPEEDKTQPSCTLFELTEFWEGTRVVSPRDPSVLRIRPRSSMFEHIEDDTMKKIRDGRYEIDYFPGCLGRSEEGSLFVTGNDQGLRGSSKRKGLRFRVITLDDEKALPTYVRFKGDNDKYLGFDIEHQVLRFAWSDGNDSTVIHSIETSPDGSFIRIKCEKTGKFWRLNQHTWVVADGDKDDVSTRFEVVRLHGNVIALKNTSNGKFAKRYHEYYVDGFNALIDSAEVYAQMKLEEAVVARKIYNVQYHIDAAKLREHKPLVMATAHSVNSSSTETTAKLTLKYGVALTRSWTKTTTETWGVNTSFHAGLPAIEIGIEGAFTIGITPDFGFSEEEKYEKTYSEEFGSSHTRTEEHSVDYDMKVPPRTKMTLRAITTQVSYDIPYSYIQKDVLANGKRIVTKFEDGLYQGVSCHEFTYKVSEEKLKDDEKPKEQ